MSAQPATSPSPTALGQPRWFFGMLAQVRASAADTGGRYTLLEVTAPAGHETPLHVHYGEDEGFYVIEGELTLYVGDEVIEATAGDFAWGPRDIPHRYTVGPNGCRMLFICVPGGFENLVRDMSEPAQSRTLPPPSDEEPDMEHVAAVAKKYNCELLVG